MLSLPAPALLNGRLLAAQLAAAGLSVDVSNIRLNGDALELHGLTEGDRAKAQPVVDAHPPTAEAETTKAQAEASNETTIRDKAAQALTANATDVATNDTFLAIASPTNAQVAAQVKELTRQSTRQARELNGLIRLVLRRFDGTE